MEELLCCSFHILCLCVTKMSHHEQLNHYLVMKWMKLLTPGFSQVLTGTLVFNFCTEGQVQPISMWKGKDRLKSSTNFSALSFQVASDFSVKCLLPWHNIIKMTFYVESGQVINYFLNMYWLMIYNISIYSKMRFLGTEWWFLSPMAIKIYPSAVKLWNFREIWGKQLFVQ